jgi:hypothetical protein
MMKKEPLYSVQVPSTDFTEEAYLFEGIGYKDIRYHYRVNGQLYLGIIRFRKVSALSRRMERCCTLWHVDKVYDTLVEVQNSEWALEISTNTKRHLREDQEYHHYMIYLDSVGCFEFIATSWEALEEEQNDEPK